MNKYQRIALERARKVLKRGEENYLCYALSCVISEILYRGEPGVDDLAVKEACLDLRVFVMNAIYPHGTLEGWSEEHAPTQRPKTAHQRRAQRIQWIDWMLGDTP
ncbi:hypothetical protein [Pararobbsia silviterrae]|uniref:Uncharacterized protein n=1 Tax=Pararobbsia silviterrae TaxID=1792498 RepID=A0A494Y311_9BURK|nr:hypothetical protein [Pararobbsia silviterrae]RKP56398.1 hypothetical protein D7S86_08355 [Pararobbsia silviterrae]